jgi:crossover junction endodeoxyribonuclease RuvC
MSFVGIDQSLNATGVCRLSEQGALETAATIVPERFIDGARLSFIKTAVASTLNGVEFAAMEGYSYNSMGRVFELGEIGGVLKVLLVEKKIPYVVVPPVLVKKFATGSTTASKDAMLAAALRMGFDFGNNDDQADAFFLARIACAHVKGGLVHRREMEVLHSLRNMCAAPKTQRRRARRLIKNAI